jgi:hypothetical protein
MLRSTVLPCRLAAEADMPSTAPRVFVSYSHDSDQFKNWVLKLADRLVRNGVDIILDQWDLKLGSDLPSFMEHGLTGANRVLAICTQRYIEKANAGEGGVGYEKMILTAQLMKGISTERIIPLIINNEKAELPTFLGIRRYVNFREEAQYEFSYAELLRDIHGQQIMPRPELGQNPFETTKPRIEAVTAFSPERYRSPGMSGEVTFDYSNNEGRYVFGAGDMAFETNWSGASERSIHAYRGSPSTPSVALAVGANEINEIKDATQYDSSSRVRSPHLGEILVWQNTSGYYLATKVLEIKTRVPGQRDCFDAVRLGYRIAPNKSPSFVI